jgi:hypothetical protein
MVHTQSMVEIMSVLDINKRCVITLIDHISPEDITKDVFREKVQQALVLMRDMTDVLDKWAQEL